MLSRQDAQPGRGQSQSVSLPARDLLLFLWKQKVTMAAASIGRRRP